LATTEYYGTGRRKTATARVFLRPGKGTIVVNKKPVEVSFPTQLLQMVIRQPLVATENVERFDVLATTAGGGVAGQAGALRLGIARALMEFDATYRITLRKAGLVTRDPRAKERKKYGMAGARKRFQFSKR
jgi:small subunit ribosomal protein S9